MIYGKSTKFVLIDLGNLHFDDGYVVYGAESNDAFGLSVSAAGMRLLFRLSVCCY